MFYFFALVAFLISVLVTPVLRQLALSWKIVDDPTSSKRKIHKKPTPFLGGWALFFSLTITLGLVFLSDNWSARGTINLNHLVGIFVSLLIIMIGGTIDDKFNIKPVWQLLISLIAIVPIVISGINVTLVNLPWGGQLSLAYWIGVLFTVVWLMVMMYTTKLLDGLDGLVTGIGALASIILFVVSLLPQLNQPQTAMLSIIFFGSCLGFLLYNWHPAEIFLGQGGSLLVGFVLGILSIVAGTKVITVLLVVGFPCLDLLWVTGRRLLIEGHSPFVGDSQHFHYRLLDAGFSHRQAVLFIWLLSFIFGFSGLLLQTRQKIISLIIMVITMLILAVIVIRLDKHKRPLID